MSLLEISALSVRFGGLTAVSRVDFAVEAGSLVALIGPNGAGKTTAFNVITGVYAPSEGRVAFDGHEIGGRAPHAISALGIARTFQNIRLFRSLSALENVRASLQGARRSGWRDVLRARRWRAQQDEAEREAKGLLAELALGAFADARADSLPYGEQRRLEIARALATRPEAAAARRARGGHEPRREAGAARADPPPARAARAHDRADRPRRVVRDEPVRPRGRARSRREDRGRSTRDGAARPGGDRGVPRQRRRDRRREHRAALGRRHSTSATGRSTRCAACRSRCARARSSR